MKTYYFYYHSTAKNNIGTPLGHWMCEKANTKKEIFNRYNKKGYVRKVKEVFTEEQALLKDNKDLKQFVLYHQMRELVNGR